MNGISTATIKPFAANCNRIIPEEDAAAIVSSITCEIAECVSTALL